MMKGSLCLILLSVLLTEGIADMSNERKFTNSLGMKMVRVDPGAFTMGFEGSPLPEHVREDEISKGPLKYTDTENRLHGDFDEHPAHRVRIDYAFHMAAFEVTNAQYEEFDPGHRTMRGMRTHGYKDRYVSEKGKHPAYEEGDDEAVTFVSWFDAVRFCEWLSEKEGIPYRLPTEAEWEYACRAGTATPYYSGDVPPAPCTEKLTTKDSAPFSLAVGQGEPNPWGLYDMHGNVEEWCRDWHGPYEEDDQLDPVGPEDGDFKVTRGGSHSSELYYLRSANRSGTIPGDKHGFIGFRVVAAPLPKTASSGKRPLRLWQKDVKQDVPSDVKQGPDPSVPYFEGPRPYVKIPEGSLGPLYSRHNHDPALEICPNGDLLAIWYTCVREPGRELALAASRFRWGATEWDPAAPFWDTPDRNDHAPALGRVGDRLFHFSGMSAGAGYRANLALVMRTSHDNGVTWSKARFVNAERGLPSQPVPSFLQTREGVLLLVSDAPFTMPGGTSILWISRNQGASWDPSKGVISGIHAGLVQLKDGRLFAMGRCGRTLEKMPTSTSSDMGKTWTYGSSPFPPIGSGQRIVLMRLQEGPILLCSFAGARRDPEPMAIKDASGRERMVTGLFAALSLDEGKTWPHVRLVSDDGPGRSVEAMDGRPFQMSVEAAEPLGYLAARQAENGVIHLITSKQHYAFNLAWLLARSE